MVSARHEGSVDALVVASGGQSYVVLPRDIDAIATDEELRLSESGVQAGADRSIVDVDLCDALRLTHPSNEQGNGRQDCGRWLLVQLSHQCIRFRIASNLATRRISTQAFFRLPAIMRSGACAPWVRGAVLATPVSASPATADLCVWLDLRRLADSL